jgi:hypothetical protein
VRNYYMRVNRQAQPGPAIRHPHDNRYGSRTRTCGMLLFPKPANGRDSEPVTFTFGLKIDIMCNINSVVYYLPRSNELAVYLIKILCVFLVFPILSTCLSPLIVASLHSTPLILLGSICGNSR